MQGEVVVCHCRTDNLCNTESSGFGTSTCNASTWHSKEGPLTCLRDEVCYSLQLCMDLMHSIYLSSPTSLSHSHARAAILPLCIPAVTSLPRGSYQRSHLFIKPGSLCYISANGLDRCIASPEVTSERREGMVCAQFGLGMGCEAAAKLALKMCMQSLTLVFACLRLDLLHLTRSCLLIFLILLTCVPRDSLWVVDAVGIVARTSTFALTLAWSRSLLRRTAPVLLGRCTRGGLLRGWLRSIRSLDRAVGADDWAVTEIIDNVSAEKSEERRRVSRL